MGTAAKALGAALSLATIAVAGCGAAALPHALPTDAPGNVPLAATTATVAVAAAQRTVRLPGEIPLSLTVPATWTLQGTVFMDGTRKVGELSPGAVLMPTADACALWPGPDPTQDTTRIEQEAPVSFGALHGLRRIERAAYEGNTTTGIWFPVAYCLQEGGKGLYITFYGGAPDASARAAFDQIAATATFTPAP